MPVLSSHIRTRLPPFLKLHAIDIPAGLKESPGSFLLPFQLQTMARGMPSLLGPSPSRLSRAVYPPAVSLRPFEGRSPVAELRMAPSARTRQLTALRPRHAGRGRREHIRPVVGRRNVGSLMLVLSFTSRGQVQNVLDTPPPTISPG